MAAGVGSAGCLRRAEARPTDSPLCVHLVTRLTAMRTWIALLRGVNVGGKNKLPMAELRTVLAAIGLADVQTYIQSGNVVFRSAAKSAGGLATRIRNAIHERFGFEPQVIVIDVKSLRLALEANPFRDLDGRDARTTLDMGKAVHFFFLEARPAKVDHAALDALAAESEIWSLEGDVFYLLLPEGVHASKLAARAEKILGVNATARNLRTVMKLAEMVEGLS